MRDLSDELLQAKVKARLFGGGASPQLGRLTILERLGAGATGTVFAAFDPKLERRVAVKVLHVVDSDRVLREARELAKLAHPNVVAIHDVGDDDGLVYIVMEMLSGVPLRVWPKKSHKDIARVMRDVALGLVAAHRVGVVHRDIKPENVVIDESGRARIVDFGPAVGTPGYMAPEVVAGAEPTPASDQYSFGKTLDDALPESAPAWLRAVAKRALSDDPAKRYPSMDAIANELGRDRRKKTIVIAVASVALLAGGGIGAAIAMTRTSPVAVADCSGTARVAAIPTRAAKNQVGADVPYAAAAIAAIDRHATAWSASYEQVCKATRVRGDQSDHLLEIRMRCLDRALDRFAALATQMSALDAATRAEVTGAVAQLPDPVACTTLVDESELVLPTDPLARTKSKSEEHELDLAWAAFALGRYREAQSRISGVDLRSKRFEAPKHLIAEILILSASIEARIGDPHKAQEQLDSALLAAAEAHAPELEYQVWLRRLRHELFSGVSSHVFDWQLFSRAAALRAGRDGGELDGVLGEAFRKNHDDAHARQMLEKALASKDPLTADQRAIIELNLGALELEAGHSLVAAPLFQRGYDATEGALGAGHPTLGLFLDKSARAAAARGRMRDALALHDRSIALRRAAFGDTDRALASALLARGQTLTEADELVRAKADLEQARAIRVDQLGAKSPRLGEIDAALGDLAAANGDVALARILFTQAQVLDPRLDLSSSFALLPLSERPNRPSTSLCDPFGSRSSECISPRAVVSADAELARWRGDPDVDASVALPIADRLREADDKANALIVYRAALAGLADEPSRLRRRAQVGIDLTK